ncbi:unnamed protein product [Ceutorhynchus assimilis]|uniref:Uncharacterized protein n=1 Tax=Ceutorhynchus assimilis TaxID=467358 RepID=A0A9N9MND3_9CUCU|nr:unnamed protein product [Ceutorhynchus assimilis]
MNDKMVSEKKENMDKVIREGTLRLLITESTCDVILSCSDLRLMAHKLVLSIASPVFRELLGKSSSDTTCVIILPDINSTTMSSILDYIYTGTTMVYRHSLDEFISVAKFLQIIVDTQNLKHDFFKKDLQTKTEKKIPDLLPIDSYRKNTQKPMCNIVVPSPWCQRDDGRFFEDPRIVALGRTSPNELEIPKSYHEDTNNNFQSTRNKEAAKHPKSLDTIIRHLYLNKPEMQKRENTKVDLPKFTNFPFSRHLTNLLPYSETSEKTESLPHPHPARNLTTSSDTIVAETTVSSPALISPSEKEHNENLSIHDDNSIDKSINSDSSHDDKNLEESENVKKKAFSCDECGKSFSQLRNYKYHRSVHEGTKEFSAKCPECGKTFNDRGYLSSHMKIHRDKKEYACPDCPKRFNQRVAYNMHLRIHTGVKPHECPTCGKSFSRKMLLKQHQRVHTGERPYSCPECGKTFADRSNMSLHARLHTGVKPYACTVCPKSFTKKHHLKTHMNFHTGLKPYKCDNCGLAFSQSSNMRTHFKKCILKEIKIGSVVKEEELGSTGHSSS